MLVTSEFSRGNEKIKSFLRPDFNESLSPLPVSVVVSYSFTQLVPFSHRKFFVKVFANIRCF